MGWVLWILAAVALLLVAGAYFAYRTAFFSDRRHPPAARDIPHEAQYQQHREELLENIDRLLSLPCETMSIRSRDGLTLAGRYCAGTPGAPLVIFFHGYRSTAARDASGGFSFCREQGYGVLLADQRAHGESEGRTITFGIREREDCLDWTLEAVRRFGPEVRIVLAGVSMGAATVLMASDLPLPQQVKGIWSDCGYTSPEAVLRYTLRRWHWPQFPTYFLAALGARLFGGFSLGESAAVEAVKKTRLPILLIHGGGDSMVPCAMAQELKNACAGPARVLIVPGAEHGISYYRDPKAYRAALESFFSGLFGTAQSASPEKEI